MTCIYLVIQRQTNRQLLKNWLAEKYRVIEIDSFKELKSDCGLVIVDSMTLGRLELEVSQFKQQQPFVPILLITPLEGIGLATRQLWKVIDELIISPINKVEMHARVHSLMQTRELHNTLQLQNEELLQRSEERYRSLFENNHTVMLIIDSETGAIITANPAAANFYGWTQQQMQCMNMAQLNMLLPVQRYSQIQPAFSQEYQRYEFQHCLADGSVRDVELFSGPIPVGNRKLLSVFVHDITERKKAMSELCISAVVFESQEGMMVTDAKKVILRVNHAFTQITGYTSEEALGRMPSMLKSGRYEDDFYVAMWQTLNAKGVWEGEIWNRRKNSELYLQYLNITVVYDQNGAVTNYVATFTDITQSKEAADKIELLAFYDPLTGLPNRRRLHDQLKPTLATSHHSGRKGALLFIDMDNFKILNDTFGHAMGDLLLQQVAKRLELCVREGDTVARLGGDEFVVMLKDLSDEVAEAAVQTELIGAKILATLNQPYQLETYEYHSTPSIGATVFNGSEQSAEELLKQADIAMYQAKASGRNSLRFFDPQMQADINTRVTMEADLRAALVDGQFELFYQPQVQNNHRIIGAEALIRWRHPTRGFVSPQDFIPLAEDTCLILPIGKWVLETACAQLKRWEESERTRNLQIAVNVSARQFHQPDFVAQVDQIVSHSAINHPARLKLELTETMVLDDVEDTINKMNQLRILGVHFSLDDFGTGYSSLSILKKLPFTQLKIDQSFVRDIVIDEDDAVIVQAIIAMANKLGMEVIAEGVESESQRLFLEQNNCFLFQGYLISRPLPIAELDLLLEQAHMECA